MFGLFKSKPEEEKKEEKTIEELRGNFQCNEMEFRRFYRDVVYVKLAIYWSLEKPVLKID